MFKTRHLLPIPKNGGKKTVAFKNIAHVKYIATRKGAMYNNGQYYGLYGKVGDMLVPGDIQSLSRVTNDIYKKTMHERLIMYRAIISFKREDSEFLELKTKEDFERLARREIPKLSELYNIRMNNLQWVMAVHDKENNPHIHICIWQKEVGVQKQYISEKQATQTRDRLIKDVYEESLGGYYKIKEQLRQEFNETIVSYTDFLKSSLLYENDVDDREYAVTKTEIKNILSAMKTLSAEIYAAGRFRYQYLPPELKEQVDEVTRLIRSVPSIAAVAEKYINNAEKIGSFYSTATENKKAIRDKTNKYIDRVISNKILKVLKELKINESENSIRHRQQKDYQSIGRLCNDIFKFFGRLTQQQNAEKSYNRNAARSKTKSARKEFAKRRGSNIDWENQG